MVSLLNTGFAQPEGPWPSAEMVTPYPPEAPGQSSCNPHSRAQLLFSQVQHGAGVTGSRGASRLAREGMQPPQCHTARRTRRLKHTHTHTHTHTQYTHTVDNLDL